jgi:hypothetical protein
VVVVEDHIRPRRLRQLLNQVDLVVALKQRIILLVLDTIHQRLALSLPPFLLLLEDH